MTMSRQTTVAGLSPVKFFHENPRMILHENINTGDRRIKPRQRDQVREQTIQNARAGRNERRQVAAQHSRGRVVDKVPVKPVQEAHDLSTARFLASDEGQLSPLDGAKLGIEVRS